MSQALVAGAYFAFAAWFFLSGLLSLASHRTGRRNYDYLALGFVNWAMSLSVVAFGATLLVGSGQESAWKLLFATSYALALFSSTGLAHMALNAVKKSKRPFLVWGLYVLAGLLSVAMFVYQRHLRLVGPLSLHVYGLPIRSFVLQADALVNAVILPLPAVVFLALALFGRAYLNGKHGSLLVFVTVGVLGLGTLNDWLFFPAGRSGALFVPLAFSALDFIIAFAFVRRYAIVRREFSRQRKKLTLRSSELRKSHEALNVVRSELGRKEQLAAIGEMASIIAHEVRNPLAVITNAAASLKKPNLRDEDRSVLLSILEEETSRLNRLVSDLLSYARPITPQRRRLLLLDLLQQTAARVDSEGADISCDETSARGQVWGDPDLLRQVFDNLVINAVQATGQGGSVVLAVRPETRKGRDGYVVTITDDGEGMDTTIRNRAKDPFFTTRPTGTGLGLAIVGRIVEAHGGEMTFDSHAGEGTTVSVFLPLGMDRGVPESQRVRDTLPPESEQVDSESERSTHP